MSNQPAAVEHHEDEGHSVAGWVGVTVMLLGFALGTLGLFIDQMIIVWVGVALIPVGAILWPLLKAFGLGPKAH